MPGQEQLRSSSLDVVSYDLLVDLTAAGDTFWSRTELRFKCRDDGAGVCADLHPVQVRRIELNGTDLSRAHLLRDGLLALPRLGGENRLIVEAEFAYAREGPGLHRAAAEGLDLACVYSNANNGGASRIFCCFDQPDLRAPITLAVRTPPGWICRANFPATAHPAHGQATPWRFAATPPLAPYLFALYASNADRTAQATAHAGDHPVPLTVWTPLTAGQPTAARTILQLARQSLAYYARVLAVPYPYPKCDLVFVPRFGPLAFSVPGLAILQDRLLQPSSTDPPLYLPCAISHEMAHAWVGGLMDLREPRERWLQEALTTYLSRAALEQTQPGSSPWDPATSASLPDHDYSPDAAPLRQLEQLIDRQTVMHGLGAVMDQHAHATITIDDLVRSWSHASRRDLRPWAATTLLPAGQHHHKHPTAE